MTKEPIDSKSLEQLVDLVAAALPGLWESVYVDEDTLHGANAPVRRLLELHYNHIDRVTGEAARAVIMRSLRA